MTAAWRLADAVFDRSLQESSVASGVHAAQLPRQAGAGSPPAIAARPKKRLYPPPSLLPRPCKVKFLAQQLPAQVAVPVDKRQRILDAIFQVAVAAGSRNVKFGPDLCQNPAAARPLFGRKFQNVPTERLQAQTAAFKRWVAFHLAHAPADMPYWEPTPLVLSQFLHHVSRGGRTAASGCLAALKW